MAPQLTPGLFERWLAIEKASGDSTSAILERLNKAANTRYRSNWPSMMASRGYSISYLPTEVRRYMMHKVLDHELKELGLELQPRALYRLVMSLT